MNSKGKEKLKSKAQKPRRIDLAKIYKRMKRKSGTSKDSNMTLNTN